VRQFIICVELFSNSDFLPFSEVQQFHGFFQFHYHASLQLSVDVFQRCHYYDGGIRTYYFDDDVNDFLVGH
jgi:hypothetical protein